MYTNAIGMPFVLIPVGNFTMGASHEDQNAGKWEKPQHSVTLTKVFQLGVYPVTQHEYERVMETNLSCFQHDAACPVETVSWFDAIEFCNRLSDLEGLPPSYLRAADDFTIVGGPGYRLPTESEWEYACRAGTTMAYSFGDDEEYLCEYGWYDANSGGHTQPVGAKKPNAWGLHDMHGNVWEWCQDWWKDNYGSEAAVIDPSGPAVGGVRVIRGGSWLDSAVLCRSSFRDRLDPSYRVEVLGFRVARSPSG